MVWGPVVWILGRIPENERNWDSPGYPDFESPNHQTTKPPDTKPNQLVDSFYGNKKMKIATWGKGLDFQLVG